MEAAMNSPVSKEVVQQKLDHAKRVNVFCMCFAERAQSAMRALPLKRDAVISTLDKNASKMAQQITEKMALSRAEVIQSVDGVHGSIQSLLARVTSTQTQLVDLSTRISKLSVVDDKIEISQLLTELDRKAKELIVQSPEKVLASLEHLDLVPKSAHTQLTQILESEQPLYFVKCCSLNPSDIHLSVVSVDNRVGQNICLQLSPLLPDGLLANMLCIALILETDGSPVDFKRKAFKNAGIEHLALSLLQFSTKTPGVHVASVTLYGEHVSGSPLKIDVRPQEALLNMVGFDGNNAQRSDSSRTVGRVVSTPPPDYTASSHTSPPSYDLAKANRGVCSTSVVKEQGQISSTHTSKGLISGNESSTDAKIKNITGRVGEGRETRVGTRLGRGLLMNIGNRSPPDSGNKPTVTDPLSPDVNPTSGEQAGGGDTKEVSTHRQVFGDVDGSARSSVPNGAGDADKTRRSLFDTKEEKSRPIEEDRAERHLRSNNVSGFGPNENGMPDLKRMLETGSRRGLRGRLVNVLGVVGKTNRKPTDPHSGRKAHYDDWETYMDAPLGVWRCEHTQEWMVCDTNNETVKVFDNDFTPSRAIRNTMKWSDVEKKLMPTTFMNPSNVASFNNGTMSVVKDDQSLSVFQNVEMSDYLYPIMFGRGIRGMAVTGNYVVTIDNAFGGAVQPAKIKIYDLDKPFDTENGVPVGPVKSYDWVDYCGQMQLISSKPRFMDAVGSKLAVTDLGADKVFMVDLDTGRLLNVIGGSARREEKRRDGQFHFVSGVRFDGGGNMVIGDAKNSRVQLFDGTSGAFICKLDLEPPPGAQMAADFVSDVHLTAGGHLMVASRGSHYCGIYKIEPI